MKQLILTVLIAVFFFAASKSSADEELAKVAKAWSGEWETSYGIMVLSVNKDGRFKGHYGSSKHSLRGQLDEKNPKILKGSWKHTGSTSNGLIRFELSKDLKTFKGAYTSGETRPNPESVNWTGTKSDSVKTGLRDWEKGEKPKWSGSWSTTYGEFVLEEKGDGRFAGTYGPTKHSVSGTLDAKNPKILRGTWKHSNSDWTGRFTFRLLKPDRFEGHWTSADNVPSETTVNWEGVRAPNKLPLRLRGGER